LIGYAHSVLHINYPKPDMSEFEDAAHLRELSDERLAELRALHEARHWHLVAQFTPSSQPETPRDNELARQIDLNVDISGMIEREQARRPAPPWAQNS
jgi:hypothetical protein